VRRTERRWRHPQQGHQTLRTTTHADLAAALGSLPGSARLQPRQVAGAEPRC
jgi:hypothetical protein